MTDTISNRYATYMRTLVLLAAACQLPAQTSVYLRAGAPHGGQISGATNSSPIVLTVSSTDGLHAGDVVSISGVAIVDSHGACSADPNPPYNTSTANGTRKIKAIVDGAHFSITDLNGADVAANGAWCAGDNVAAGEPASAQTFGKLTSFNLVDHPRGMFDGPNGPVTRHWALGTQNGLISLAVSGSHIATATTAFTHDVHVNDPISLWGTTSAALNNGRLAAADYVVTAVTGTAFQFNVPDGIPAGDYTYNNACGPAAGNPNTIGGAGNCVRISQFAVQSSPAWAHVCSFLGDASWYTSVYDGGARGDQLANPWSMEAALFLVDQSNQAALNAVLYGINSVERVAGSNFSAYEGMNDGGTTELSDFASQVWNGMALVYEAGRNYLTPAQKATYLAKMYNDISDPAPCVKIAPLQKTLASGTARAADATHITLASSDSHADSYYVNNVIAARVGGSTNYGVVTAYNATTKVATVAGWQNAGASGNPTAGTAYTIYAAVTLNGNSVTGYGTAFTADVHVGDMLYAGNTWGMQPAQVGMMVTAINSDTSATVISGPQRVAFSQPYPLWWVPKWNTATNTDCGLQRLQNYWAGAVGVQPIQYPPRAGEGRSPQLGVVPYGQNNGYTYENAHMLHGLVAAEDDPRASRNLTVAEGEFFDYLLPVTLNYQTGFTQSGTSYGWQTGPAGMSGAWTLQHSVVGFPSMNTSGPWVTGLSMLEMYLPRPDAPMYNGEHTKFMAPYGTEGDSVWLYPYGQQMPAFVTDHGMAFNPTAPSSGYLKSFLNAVNAWSTNRIDGANTIEAAIKIDPRIVPNDYTTQPTQYYFGGTDTATCASLTGWPCPPTFRADAFISRTGWSSDSDTHLFYQARGYFADHDNPEAGDIQLWKAGPLLASDILPPGGHGGYLDSGVSDSAIQFSGTSPFKNNLADPMIAFISRWASANRGTWPPPYGDRNSNYVYAMSDLTGAYLTTYNHVWEHVAHFKKPGTEEVVMVFDDVDLANAPTQVVKHWHFPQNGESPAGNANLIYAEGNTTVSAGTVIEQQSGLTANGDPPHVYNLIGKFFSPGTITARDDGSSFTGANGHTRRISLCGGGACGSTVSTYRQLSVFKIAAQPDITLTATALNPDSHWTGVQTADKVALFAVGGSYSTISNFTTTHPGAAQYLIAGLAPGRYVVRVGSDPVTGSPFTVASGDGTIYFESVSGAVSVRSAALQNPAAASITGGTSISAGAGH